ncbi:peptide/nickel transport system substrate-binding protein [Rhodoferax ferrireducens]|uniref:Peptide/nickel transport system substrate-binding protein n=1 Tax=Rhodoferax ferrireducens TaxID=192843 RepID=A0ABU2CAN5_9BURK|nr:ABC transporter substrate-binding protein [Rhodoferax ferrireducens]MDR7378415.1 peptide/nickel transport system substrate-binding protein [Rhodoferax ferrireducens]
MTLVSALVAALLGTPAGHAETLRWARSTDASTLDPHALNNGPNHNLLHQVYEPLIIRNADGKLLPTLAASWALTRDPTVWEFKLRKGVKFHDGSLFTADDVLFSLQRARAPTSDMRSLLVSITDVVKVDPFTVHIKTSGPNPLLPDNLINIQILSAAWAKAHGVEQPQNASAKEETYATRNVNGTGPYTLVSREQDSRTVLKLFPGYWGRGQFPLEIDELVYLPIKSPATRVAALLSGEVDFVQDLPIQDIARLRADPKLRVNQAAENRTIFLGLNVGTAPLTYSDVKDKNPLADRRVRQAFQLAIDRNTLQTAVMRGLSVPTNIIAPPFVHGYEKAFGAVGKSDAAQAKKLLAEAGYPNGFGITLHCTNDRYLNDEAICQAVSGFLGRIGVKTTVVSRPLAIQTAAINNQDTDFYLYGWGVPTYDSAYIFDYLVHTRGKNARGATNATRFSNAEVDRQIVSLASEGDAKKRDATIKSIWTTVQKELIYLPLHDQIQTYAMVRKFDIPVNPSNTPYFKFFKVSNSASSTAAAAQ